MSNYTTPNQELFNVVEEAIFHAQCKDTREVLNYIRNVAKIREFQDWKAVEKLIHEVATQYKRREPVGRRFG
jgi:ribosomal protein L17